MRLWRTSLQKDVSTQVTFSLSVCTAAQTVCLLLSASLGIREQVMCFLLFFFEVMCVLLFFFEEEFFGLCVCLWDIELTLFFLI